MCEVNREQPVYDKVLNITLLQNLKEEKNLSLTFRILNGTRNINITGHIEKVIHFEVTDENDPFFLFLLDIGENDFHRIKRDQSILVEFSIFPLKFIELIDLCLQSNNNYQVNSINSDNLSTYTAKLDTNTGIFSIVESNRFKQLTHISLELLPGNDHDIKSYLASRLYMASSLSRYQAVEINKYEKELQNERMLRRDMSKELQDLKSHKEIQVESLQSSHSQEIAKLQRQHMEILEEQRRKLEYLQESSHQEINNIQSAYQNKIKLLEENNSELSNANKQQEFKLKDLSRQLENAETDRERLLIDLTEVSNQRRTAEESRSQLDREVARLEAKLDGINQQLINKEEAINKTMALYKSSEENRSLIEQKLQLYINTIEELNDKLEGGKNEIQRGNNVIAKYQSENKQLKDKMKTKSEVIRRQELYVNQQKDKINELEKIVIELKNDKNQLTNKINELKRLLDETNENLEKAIEKSLVDKHTIEYLNGELNKSQGFWLDTINDKAHLPKSLPSTNNPSTNYTAPNDNKAADINFNTINRNYMTDRNPQVMSVSPDSVSNKAIFKSPNKEMIQQKDQIFMKGAHKLGLTDLISHSNKDLNIGADLNKLDFYASAEAVNPVKSTSKLNDNVAMIGNYNISPSPNSYDIKRTYEFEEDGYFEKQYSTDIKNSKITSGRQ